ncbi:hypothetical protein HYFRA_00004577 [Hymenoscyphus fraxineus]|uniref:Protein kinase domain-containing protein n=1 Tax=Hymenoscyphus fraxineus TaxID=746836 RepID=A0A9N9KVQ7_9HELO|nr:hypothetical protein HYFRA_00004577 [Hymenoscyphus fraxineus]
MSAELALAIVGVVDLCLKYGKELRKICKALRGAEEEIEERALRQVHEVMDDDHKALYERTLRMLVGKLEVATSILKGLVKVQVGSPGDESSVTFTPRALKYAFRKDGLDEAIEALETWQRISDPSWFLILKKCDDRVDKMLANEESQLGECIPSTSIIRKNILEDTPSISGSSKLWLPSTEIAKMELLDIRFSNSRIARKVRSNATSTYILDNIGFADSKDYSITKLNIRDLARRLQHVDPQTFGLLNCKGFVEETPSFGSGATESSFMVVFRTPPTPSTPRSLRDFLVNMGKPNSLSQRFSIAQELAKSVTYVHVFGFVHKNIRPENILLFENLGKEPLSVYLLGFEGFRKEEGRTRRLGDETIERNLYRHPSRQGAVPADEFIMQHDIYNFGVCLLEIGLWESFVTYDSNDSNATLSGMFGFPPTTSKEELMHFILSSSKDYFLSLAQGPLRECMGTKYSEVVQTCLTCLDSGNSDFGDPKEFEDEDGIRVGVRYIEKILSRLNSLSV